MKQDDELLEIIPLVLGCNNSANGKEEGVLIETDVAKEILESLKDNSFSHLMEVTELLLRILWYITRATYYGHVACFSRFETVSRLYCLSRTIPTYL